MSKPKCIPHKVVVYKYIETEVGPVLRMTGVSVEPSKGCAEKLASRLRKQKDVSSAVVSSVEE